MGLFSSGKPKLEIDKQNKVFAESILLWLAVTLGDEIPRKRGQLFPTAENFNYKNLKSNEELFRLVRHVAELVDLQDKYVRLEIFNSQKQVWKEYFPFDNPEVDTKQLFSLFLTEEVLPYPELALRSVMLQLFEKKFMADIPAQDMLGWTAEIAADYYGLGLISLRNTNEYVKIKTGRKLTLPYEIHVYVTCMLYELTGNSSEGLELYLSPDEFKNIERMRKAIRVSDDFLKFKEKWDRALKKHPLYMKELRLSAYDPERIEVYSQLLAIQKGKKKAAYYNNRGYTYLLNNSYAEAITDFNLAIEVDPYFAFAFNNRGFSKLMLGNMEGGLEDIEISIRLDHENSYSYRNKGIYYFKKENYVLALDYYLKAIEMQAEIEHIHFHLGTAYLALGNKEKAAAEFELSRKLPELPVPDYPAGY